MELSKSNKAKLLSQEKMRKGEILGHINPEWARKRYLVDVAPIEDIAVEMGCSVIQTRRYMQAFGYFRDRGAIYRANSKPKPRKGDRLPGSKRHPDSHARRGSAEHREKLATAKRGKKGLLSNRWKGGHKIGGYVGEGGKYKHRIVAENLLERELVTREQVHHMDRDRRNNDPCNLLVLSDKDHTRLHCAMRRTVNLDQRAWLRERDINFEDLKEYAENSVKEAC